MFRLPPITKNLLVINILLFFAVGILSKNGISTTFWGCTFSNLTVSHRTSW